VIFSRTTLNGASLSATLNLLMFIENCLVNNCLIMITAKASVFLSLLKFIDADW